MRDCDGWGWSAGSQLGNSRCISAGFGMKTREILSIVTLFSWAWTVVFYYIAIASPLENSALLPFWQPERQIIIAPEVFEYTPYTRKISSSNKLCPPWLYENNWKLFTNCGHTWAFYLPYMTSLQVLSNSTNNHSMIYWKSCFHFIFA